MLGVIIHSNVIIEGHEATQATFVIDCHVGLLCFNISLHQSDAGIAFIMEHLTRGLCEQVQFSIHPLLFYGVFMYSLTACNVRPLNLSGLRGAPGYSLEQAHHLPIEMDPLIGQCMESSTAYFVFF